MKHCHFSILYNELPFLKQKLPFLYEHFDQLIFFDLNVGTFNPHFSTDGSHEFIRDYPDPESKITLIEKKNIEDVREFTGAGSIEKQKMFAVGSQYVNDDIDVFWCSDLDEFFNKSFIKKVEKAFECPDVNSVDLEHYLFWKDFDHILCYPESDSRKMFARICRHKKGNIYGHCSLQDQFPHTLFLEDEKYYHFSWIGDSRVINKLNHYCEPPTGNPVHKESYRIYWENIWQKFNPKNVIADGKTLYGYPKMHPNNALKMGIKKFIGDLPSYVNYEELKKDLNK